MQYLMLIVNPSGTLPPEEQLAPIMAQFNQIDTELRAKGKLVHASRLRPTSEAKTVKAARDGHRAVVDGPFAETKETIGGYYVIDCASQTEAVEWAKKFPSIFEIEVRALWQM